MDNNNHLGEFDNMTAGSLNTLEPGAEGYLEGDAPTAPQRDVPAEGESGYFEDPLSDPPVFLEDVIEDTFALKTLTPDQIPNIDLYMDQVITLFNENLGFTEVGNDKITKAMINNYRKENIISPMKGKRYSRTQVYQILFIYYLKQAMPIADIKTVLNVLEMEGRDLEGLYNAFLTDIAKQNQDIKKQCENAALDINANDKEELARLLLQIAGAVSQLSNLSKNIVDRLF